MPITDHLLVPLRSRAGIAIVAATVLASGIAWYDAYVVNVAVPAIGTHFGAGVASVQWTLTAYLLAVASLLLLAGALADRFGRRRVLVVGLLVMLGASFLCAAAQSIGWLIGARAVQGIGAALVVPISLALLNGTLRVADRAKGIGIWAGLSTALSTIGPYGGGWLIDNASWRWVFLLPLPLFVAVFAVLRHVPETTRERPALSVDVVGAVLGVVGLGGLIYALTEGPGAGWSSARVLVPGVIGALALIALLPVENRRRAPLLRLSLFESRQFDAINVVTVLVYGALAAGGYLFVVNCQLSLGYTAAQAGAALIPASIVFLLLSPLSGALVSRLGPRWLMFAGILIIAGAHVWLAQAAPGSSYVGTILPAALVLGVGEGVMVAPLTAAVLAAVSDADLGEASAINDAAARVGALALVALVPLLIGATAGSSLADSLTDGYRPAMLVLAGVCAVAAVLVAVFVSNERATAPRLAPPAPHHGCALAVTRDATVGAARES